MSNNAGPGQPIYMNPIILGQPQAQPNPTRRRRRNRNKKKKEKKTGKLPWTKLEVCIILSFTSLLWMPSMAWLQVQMLIAGRSIWATAYNDLIGIMPTLPQ
jgi:hypothetical protein